MGLRRRRALRRFVAPLVAAVVLFPFGVVAAQPACSNQTQNGNWLSIDVDDFPRGAEELVAFNVDFANENHLLATNGPTVLLSEDGGCSWELALDLASSPVPLEPSAHVVSFPFPYAQGVTVILVEESLPAPRPRVLYTDDGGHSWTDFAQGLTTVPGRPLDFGLAADAYYVLVDQGQDAAGVAHLSPPHALYVSTDAGATWERRAAEPPGTTVGVGPLPPQTIGGEVSGTLDGLAPNYATPGELWLYGSAGLYHSDDAGATARPFGGEVITEIGEAELRYLTQTQAFLTGWSAARPAGYRSLTADSDDGFVVFATPTAVASASFPVIAGPGGVFRELLAPSAFSSATAFRDALRTPLFLDISPADGRAIVDLITFGSPLFPDTYGRTATTIERYEPQPPVFDPNLVPEIPRFDVAELKKPKLMASQDKVVLRRGQTKTVLYTLGIPPTPTPLDVFFLVDVSGSMQGAINGVRAGLLEIIRELRALGVDVWFGVGEYRSFNDPPAYFRRLDMSSPGAGLRAALNGLQANGGGLETQLYALYRAAGGDGSHSYEPESVHFRTGSLRVVVHASDENFSEGGSHPSFETTIDALNARDIKQVGIAPGGNVGGVSASVGPGGVSAGVGGGEEALVDMRRVAQGTGALAPPQGADCDGDGVADIHYQEPLACGVPHSDEAEDGAVMADVIVTLLTSLRDDGGVFLGVEGDDRLVERVIPDDIINVNFKQPNQLNYAIRYHCPRLEKQAASEMKITASRAAGPLASTTTTVICRVPPPKVESKPVLPFLLPLVPFVPLPPRPPDVAPNPNPQPNPQGQGQGQGAFAVQEQEKRQLAYAHVSSARSEQLAEEKSADQFAFSSLRRERELPSPALALIAGAMMGAAGAALSRSRARLAGRTTGFRRRRIP